MPQGSVTWLRACLLERDSKTFENFVRARLRCKLFMALIEPAANVGSVPIYTSPTGAYPIWSCRKRWQGPASDPGKDSPVQRPRCSGSRCHGIMSIITVGAAGYA